MNLIPNVKMNKEIYGDIFSTLLEQRNVMVQGPITSDLACVVNAQLLYLASKSDDPIEIYIDSPGGSVLAGLAIIDMMSHVKSEIATIVCGQAASMGAVIFSAGTPGKRFMLTHSQCMVHQPYTGFEGKESDIRLVYEHISYLKNELIEILAQNCHRSLDEVEKDIENDRWMNADDCIAYGLADKILDR